MHRRSLVVDDELAVCQMIQEVMNAAGMNALTLTRSADAAQALQKEKFDVVLLDLRMPAPDGAEVAREMRGSGFNRSTPIIMISEDQQLSAVSEGFKAGASFFLYKPIDKGKLLQLLRASQGAIEHEKRRFRRIEHRAKVRLNVEGESFEGETVDISMNGMLVSAGKCVPAGSAVRIELVLVPGAKAFVASGSVMRTVSGNQMGIEFSLMNQSESCRLQELLLPLVLQG